MMNLSKRTALHLSLFVISFYWLYQLIAIKQMETTDGNFSHLVFRVAVTKAIHLAVILLLLKIENDGWSDMGFQFNNWKKQLLFGLVLGLGMFLLINMGLTSILNSIIPPADSKNILTYFTEPRNIYIWLAMGIFGGGVVEEVMRIFVLTRFQKKFGPIGLYFSLVFSSFLFGAAHLYQGLGSAISTGIYGFILGYIFIKRKSAIEVITIHAFSDVLSILAAFQMASHHRI